MYQYSLSSTRSPLTEAPDSDDCFLTLLTSE